jgi:hypothetical protein
MKTDAPLPARVPTKRSQIGRLADLHIAIWLDGDTITEAERALLQREKDRRKNMRRLTSVGVVVPLEGMTPAQRRVFREWKEALAPCEVVEGDDARLVAKVVSHLIVCPRSSRVPADMADAMKIARRRNVSVRVVLPDGREG